ncbi:MAG: regulatory protein [Chitinophagales bacterium]|jgi:regulatory protein
MPLPNELSQQLDQASEEEAKNRASLSLSAMNMLAMREHSRFELEQKLSKKSEDEKLIIEVLNKLESDTLLSDQRFAQMFIRSKANNGFGPHKIDQELQAKGVGRELIADTLVELNIDWFEKATQLYLKRITQVTGIDIKEKHKQSRYLQNRGFSVEIVRAVVGELY